ncbi:hypothetical protein [Croceibacterium mercuriale]|uniref:hypothetical protein n=1 Tax=Croceibacterium mercuriale TaxID=1572751 RepID=UPI00190FBA91|nr:hypothetical protein [Croceibacterium mercuriale]
MSDIDKQEDGSLILSAVQAVAISPDSARELVARYKGQISSSNPNPTTKEVNDAVIDKIISRYAKLAAGSGATTSLAGVIPGVGTAVAALGGGFADIVTCMKLQVDMTMCLCMAINNEVTDEDARHMTFYIAVAGSLEQVASGAGSQAAAKAAAKVVGNALKGATLQTIKQLFKQLGITFTKKAAMRVIPFGIGVVISAGANYALTNFVGSVARDVLMAEHKPAIT